MLIMAEQNTSPTEDQTGDEQETAANDAPQSRMMGTGMWLPSTQVLGGIDSSENVIDHRGS